MSKRNVDEQSPELGAWLPVAGVAAIAATGLLLLSQANESQSKSKASSYNTQQLASQVQQLLLQGQASQAISLLRRAIELDPQQSLLYSLAAWAFLNIGQPSSSFSYAQKAIKLASTPLELAQGYYMIGCICTRAGNWNEGINALITCLNSLDNQYTQLRSQSNHLLGSCYYAKRSYKDSVRYFLQALQLHPQNLDVASCLGYAYLQLGAHHKAIHYYQYALQLLASRQNISFEHKNVWISKHYLSIGVVFYDLDNFTESFQYFEAAYKAYQLNPYALVNLAELSARNENLSEMSFYLEQAVPCLHNTPYFPEATGLIGRLCSHSGFLRYRDKVLGLLMRQSLISPRDYQQALQDWEKQARSVSSKIFHIENSKIGILNDGNKIYGEQNGEKS